MVHNLYPIPGEVAWTGLIWLSLDRAEYPGLD